MTLGDDTGAVTGPTLPFTVEMGSWGLVGLIQDDALAGQDTPYIAPLGNLKGPFSFTAKCSFPTIDAGAADFGTKSALVSQLTATGVLVLKTTVAGGGFKTFTYSGAVLESVMRDESKSLGVRWAIKYQFRTSGAPVIT